MITILDFTKVLANEKTTKNKTEIWTFFVKYPNNA